MTTASTYPLIAEWIAKAVQAEREGDYREAARLYVEAAEYALLEGAANLEVTCRDSAEWCGKKLSPRRHRRGG